MFITLEGIEGSGKTTLIENLADVFRTLNHEVLVTREPGGCALGRELRQMLLNPETEICPEAELFLFLADRAQHVAEVIRPALKRGEVVLCDRYADSTVVYQGYGAASTSKNCARSTTWPSAASGPTGPLCSTWTPPMR